MKKLLRTEDVLVALISAIGWGLGYAFPKVMKKSEIVCYIFSILIGIAMYVLGTRLIKAKWEKKNRTKRDLMIVVTVVVFLSISYFADDVLGHSLFEDLKMQIVTGSVGFTVAGFLISWIIQTVKKYIIESRYKDGSTGHRMSRQELEYIEKLNGENKEIIGRYNSNLAVKTENGIFVAKKNRKVHEFLGIPYAKPPIGSLRWRVPQKPDPSDRVWEAYYFGASPIQVDEQTISLKTHRQSEDCLTLNVWRSAQKDKNSKLKPVLVYIHGGNLLYGGSAEPLYCGRAFVEEFPEVIVVSLNYRLGIFGFLNICDMPKEAESENFCNLGLLDQLMAIRWVHDNIRSFGGNPENIMLAGDTMGAYCIKLLSTIKESKGLFKKALLISCDTVVLKGGFTPEKIRFEDLAGQLGVKTVDEMRNIPADTLKKFMSDNVEKILYQPAIDEKMITKDSDRAIRDGDTGDVRFIFGIPNNEVSTLTTISDEETMRKWFSQRFDWLLSELNDEEEIARIQRLVEHYKKEGESEVDAKNKALDFMFYRYDSLMACMDLSNLGKTVRCFYWNVKPPVKKFGGNSISCVGTLLNNANSAENLGYYTDSTVKEVFQHLIFNDLVNDKPQLRYEEVKGVDDFVWETFSEDYPIVLHVSNESVEMDENVLKEDIRRIRQWYG